MEHVEQFQDTALPPAEAQVDVRALTPPTPRQERVANLLVIATLAVALLLGWALMSAVQGRTATYSDSWISLAYPAHWVVDQDEGGNVAMRNPRAANPLFNDRIVIFHGDLPGSGGLPGDSPLARAATAWTLNRSRELDGFRNLATVDGLTVAGQPAIRIDFAYVTDPSARLGRPGIPVVVRGSDVVLVTGDRVTVISGQTDGRNWNGFQPELQTIVDSATAAQGG